MDGAGADVRQRPYIPYLEGFGAFPENDKNAGVHVVLDRHKDTPKELLDGQDVFLTGDCTKTQEKRLDEVGAISYHVNEREKLWVRRGGASRRWPPTSRQS
ncbi:MAG: hypothetical protein ACYC6T_02350 [Thermoleophilia bacterium]